MAQSVPSLDRASRPISERPLPDLITEIPGPKAREHVKFDEEWTSPSLPARLPDRAGPRPGHGDRGHRRQPVPRLRGGHRRQLDRPRPPARHRRDQGAGDRADPLLGVGLLPPDLRRDGQARSRDIAPMQGKLRTYLGNSGAEVVEASMKLARHYTGRPYIVGFLGGFHGRTYGAVTLTASKAKYHARLRPAPARRLPRAVRQGRGPQAGSTSVLFKRLIPADEVAAIVIEPIQGEGGYIVPEDGFLAGPARAVHEARHPARRRRDPVGRRPDREDVGDRALGRRAGHPARRQGHRVGHAARRDGRAGRRSWSRGAIGAHGSTYGGNPVACAAALATIELLEGGLDRQRRGARRAGDGRPPRAAWPRTRSTVLDVRGKGLMIGVEFARPEARRGRPVGVLPARPARARVRRADGPAVPAAGRVAADVDTAVRIFGEAVAAVAAHPPRSRARPPPRAACTTARSTASADARRMPSPILRR